MLSSHMMFLAAACVFSQPSAHITQTINPDPSWQDPTPEEFAAQAAMYEPFHARYLLGTLDSPEMLVLLEEGLCDSIGTGLLQQWVDDIESEEYTAQVVEVSYGQPEEIKGLLDSLHAQGLRGTVLVGNLPAAWVAVWDTEVSMGEQLPCDYFFMDLDGEWLDLWVGYPRDSIPGPDGFYDTFEGELDPEIWCGRIRVDNLTGAGDPMQMLRDYLERNHDWRVNGDPEPIRALCYVDDDWQYSGETFRAAMEMLYENVELVNKSPLTTAHDYEEERLPDSYVWISPFVHSTPADHYWQPAAGMTNWSEIVPIAPPAHFYNLFACSNCRFTTGNNMGGVYALAAPSGLGAVGSTCSGAMLWFEQFYGPLGGGGSLGEAFMLWWDYIAQYGLSQQELNWHIGMVLLGDPSLVPEMHALGVSQEQEGQSQAFLHVSPNPSPGSVSVEFALPQSLEARLEVYDLSGRIVVVAVEPAGGSGSLRMDLSLLPEGIYILRLVAGDLHCAAKVVIGSTY
ncbi:T9SS type A sorting domain-containing protein [Candidatus Fermentibacterales bacterium]|nr:T9SS type A sorting domain-containing protein [Candidatus Fermentibacterales bacterium]